MIHSSAIISPEVEIGEDVTIGPYVTLNGKIQLGRGTRIESHVCIGMNLGHITIGEHNHFFSGSVIGMAPQDLGYNNEETSLVIGDNNIIREYSTIHLGTLKGHGATTVGNNNLFMAYTHIAHDCEIGNHVVIANNAQLAGHVIVEDRAVIGGCCGLTQFVKLGAFCYISGYSAVNKDILPFSIADGRWALIKGTNKVGLERAEFPKNEIQLIHKALRYLIKGKGTIDEIIEQIRQNCIPSKYVDEIIHFTKNSKKGLAK